MAVHVAVVVTAHVNALGNVVRKDDPEVTLGEMATASQELRIQEDAAIPSSTGFPDIKTYIELEEVANFRLGVMNQTYIITYD